ncbi:MAG TPA: M20/M25/M40 family metallo-hydrolase [Thermoanaerobaculia bacterium]|nr:M20/M25/M40 family metallo-hydrolase [Thermoanaerobaculia bacterium]
MRKVFAAVLLCSVAAAPLLPAEERVDLEMVTAIRQEGFRNSKVMETASQLMDSIGPRLTGSPNMKRANEWTRKQLSDWGLVNAHIESWEPFGRGWSYEVATVRMISPDVAELLALPQAWSPGTNGPLRAKAVKVKLADKDDLEKAKGQLAGKIVLIGETRDVKPQEKALSERYDEKTLAELERYEVPGVRPYMRAGVPFNREEFAKRREFQRALNKFLVDEKVAAVLDAGQLDGGTFRVQGLANGHRKNAPAAIPTLVMAIEHWERLARILDRKQDVELEINLKTTFTDEPSAANTIAEIPGTDKKGELVMLGAHMDSWHGGTGATDNGAGVAAMMEAVRILKALNVKPRRTIRIALWSGEEQGLLGSRGYVSQHFASRPQPPERASGEDDGMPSFLRPPTGPLTIKPEHAKVSAYFNLDNGTGKVRGIYAQENAAVVPIFESWIQPLKDLGVTAVTMRNTSGTDHLSFDSVGLPGFQFIQDEVEYETRTHHTNMDVYERLQKEDLMQASVVIACFVYNAAMRDAMLPRKPLPKDQPAAEPTPGAKGPLAKPETPAGAPEKAPTPAPVPRG